MDEITTIYKGMMLNNEIGYMAEGPWAGWIFARHPNGHWVSLCQIPQREALIKRIAELEAELSRYKLKWQTGPVPEEGRYWTEWACELGTFELDLLSPGEYTNLIRWAGPIQTPEE